MIDLNKKESENERQYIWRICRSKDDGLLDIDWKDLADVFNKELRDDETEYYSESAYRKAYQYASAFYDDVFKHMLNDDNYIKEIDIKIEELKKERYKLSTTNIERNKYLRIDARKELFYENIGKYIKELPLPVFQDISCCSEESKIRYILTIADIHAGANFITDTNEYSLDICKDRFEHLLREIINFVQDKNVRRLDVIELGDSVQGILRLNDIKLNETNIVESTVFVAQILSEFLNRLSEYCFINYYHVPTSNHTQIRPLGSKSGEMKSDDVEYIISHYIQDMLKSNERVSVYLNDNQEYIEINHDSYNMIAMHGHQIKNVKDALKDLSLQNRTFYDIIFLAHFHGGNEIVVGECLTNDAEVLICPSFIGSDPYSDSLFKGSKASCKIFGISERGHTETYKIILN